jgi:hypothetical protein
MADCRLLHGERAWLAGGADTDLQRVYQRIGWISGLCMIDDDVMVSSCCCRDDDVVMAVMAHSKSRAISPSPTHKYPINNIGIILDKFKCTNSSVKKLIQIKVGCCDWIHMYLFEKRGFCFRLCSKPFLSSSVWCKPSASQKQKPRTTTNLYDRL